MRPKSVRISVRISFQRYSDTEERPNKRPNKRPKRPNKRPNCPISPNNGPGLARVRFFRTSVRKNTRNGRARGWAR